MAGDRPFHADGRFDAALSHSALEIKLARMPRDDDALPVT